MIKKLLINPPPATPEALINDLEPIEIEEGDLTHLIDKYNKKKGEKMWIVALLGKLNFLWPLVRGSLIKVGIYLIKRFARRMSNEALKDMALTDISGFQKKIDKWYIYCKGTPGWKDDIVPTALKAIVDEVTEVIEEKVKEEARPIG